MRAAACMALLLASLLAGCSAGGDGEASVDRSELAALVLQPGDVPAAFVRFDHGPQIGADAPAGPRADAGRFGRLDGWKARYRRPGSSETRGALVIESRVDLFEGRDGAEDELEAAREDLRDTDAGWRPIDEPGLGDQSFAATLVVEALSRIRHYQVVWRHDNVSATLAVNGFEGKLALADVLELARKQQRRIENAAR